MVSDDSIQTIVGQFSDEAITGRQPNDSALGAGCTQHHFKEHPEFLKEVPAFTINAIVEKYNIPKRIPFMFLDVEGFEFEVLKGWDPTMFRPYIACIETDHTKDLIELMNTSGYNLIESVSHNLIFKDVKWI